MKREELKTLGFSDEHIDTVMKMNGSDIEQFKTQVSTLTTERDTFKTQAEEAGKQIEGFKGMDIEGVKKAASDWEAKAKQVEADAAAQVAKVKFDYALDKELQDTYKVKDVVAVKAHLKADVIQFKDDKFIGLKEQIDPLKTSKDFLFESDKQTPRIVSGGNNQSVNVDALTAGIRQGAKLPEAQGK